MELTKYCMAEGVHC
jgi:hypothetical protein